MHYPVRFFLVVLIARMVLVVCASAQDTSSFPFMNPKLSPEERAADLVHRMTLEERLRSS